ncbi:MAG: hypothetical protein ACFE7R_00625, partial [Candidatus Hodarchaeota archaeon]
MTLFQACVEGNESHAATSASDMISKSKPSALWAILMHAAAWHEQKEFDTPHSTIITFSVHRMVEELGSNPDILSITPPKPSMKVPEEL